jgi:4'-phosphopantetheinyl transferase EntD
VSEHHDEPIIAKILPAYAFVAEALDDIGHPDLFPEELALVRGAVRKRRNEFAVGRHLARRALSELGVSPRPILCGPNREPAWPDGIVGSITHCSRYCAAAVASADVIYAIGIDAEINDPLPEDVLRVVARRGERNWIASRTDRVYWDRILFSAKESVFKASFPVTRRWLEFDDMEVTFDPSSGKFNATILTEGPVVGGRALTHLEGRYLVSGSHLFTSVVLLRGPMSM